MQCGSSKQPVKAQAIGDMRHLIQIFQRSITQTNNQSPDFTETFTLAYTVWAKLVTVKPKKEFAGTNINREVTHEFYIRYIAALDADIESNFYILYKNEYYDIFDIEDLDERHRFMKLPCSIRGDSTLPVNYT